MFCQALNDISLFKFRPFANSRIAPSVFRVHAQYTDSAGILYSVVLFLRCGVLVFKLHFLHAQNVLFLVYVQTASALRALYINTARTFGLTFKQHLSTDRTSNSVFLFRHMDHPPQKKFLYSNLFTCSFGSIIF